MPLATAVCRGDKGNLRGQAAARARSGSSSILRALASVCLPEEEEADSSPSRDRGLHRGEEMTHLGIIRSDVEVKLLD